MQLTRYNPTNRMARRWRGNRAFDELLDGFFAPAFVSPASLESNIGAKVDIYEQDEQIVFEAELAGVAKEDISVDVKGKLLTLGGERKSTQEVQQDSYYRKERSYGRFERTFTLPFEITEENVKAEFKDGILRLEIAKPEQQQTKKITIN